MEKQKKEKMGTKKKVAIAVVSVAAIAAIGTVMYKKNIFGFATACGKVVKKVTAKEAAREVARPQYRNGGTPNHTTQQQGAGRTQGQRPQGQPQTSERSYQRPGNSDFKRGAQ